LPIKQARAGHRREGGPTYLARDIPPGGARSEENHRPLAAPGGARSKEADRTVGPFQSATATAARLLEDGLTLEVAHTTRPSGQAADHGKCVITAHGSAARHSTMRNEHARRTSGCIEQAADRIELAHHSSEPGPRLAHQIRLYRVLSRPGPVAHDLLDLLQPEPALTTGRDVETEPPPQSIGESAASPHGQLLHHRGAQEGTSVLMLVRADVPESAADAPVTRPFPVVLVGVSCGTQVAVGDQRPRGTCGSVFFACSMRIPAHPLLCGLPSCSRTRSVR